MTPLARLRELVSATRDTVRTARLYHGFLTKRPILCIVQVSNRCNLTCGFCSFWQNPAPREHELTTEDFDVISSKLAEAGSMIISLEGGEPLLRRDIGSIVRAFARHHHPILFTNGWPVTESLAGELWSAGLTQVGVSIDYPDAARHDARRGRAGTFEAALRALEIFRTTAPQGRRQVCVMTVLMHDNHSEMESLLELSARQGVNHQITLLSASGTGRQRSAPPGAGASLVALKQRHPHFVTFTGYLEAADTYLAGNPRTPCWAGERFLNVDHLGEVAPCIWKLHLSAGNLRRDPWSVIAERLADLREPETCRACYTSCRGFVEEMSGWPRRRSWRELMGDFAEPSMPST